MYYSFVDEANCTTFDPAAKEGECDLSMLNDRPVFVPGDESLCVVDDNDRAAVRVEGSSFVAPSDVYDDPDDHEYRRAISREEFSRHRHRADSFEVGESDMIWVSLTSDPDESHGHESVASSAVTVIISGSSPDWVADPLSLTFTRENWREAQPFTLSAVDDEIDELLETHFAAVSSHSSGAVRRASADVVAERGVAGVFGSERVLAGALVRRSVRRIVWLGDAPIVLHAGCHRPMAACRSTCGAL